MNDPEGPHELNVTEFAALIFQLGDLKLEDRAGWKRAGVQQPESEADHRFRSAIIGYALGAMEGADAGRTAMLCLLGAHPLGDLATNTALRPAPLSEAGESRQSTDLLVNLIADFGNDYVDGRSLEAQLAQDAEHIETLVQAFAYEAFGHPLAKQWVEDSYFKIISTSGRKLAGAAIEVSAEDWRRPLG